MDVHCPWRFAVKQVSRTVLLIVLIAAGCAPVKTAPLPDDPVAQFPNMQVGDKYTFVISGTAQEKWEVTSVKSDGSFVLRETSGVAAGRREMKVDSSYWITSDRRTMLGDLKLNFPLFPGKRWSYAYEGVDRNDRQTSFMVDYRVVAYETVQTNAGALRVFKINYTNMARTMNVTVYGELWYSPEAKMIVFNDATFRSHKLLAFSVTADPGQGATAHTAAVQRSASGVPSPTASSGTASGASAGASADVVRLAEEKVATALKAQQEKEAALRAQAQRLAEKEAALKAEANRLTEERLATEARRLEEQEAVLKAEAARLETARREAAAKAKREQESAAKALAAAKARAEAENIETNIPVAPQGNPDAIAVVVGNRDYKYARPVSFAASDAELMKKYLVSALGLKDGNVFLLTNASKSDFELLFGNERNHRGKLFNAVKAGRSDVVIYYSGHGAPGLKDRRGYFVPVEADPQYLELSGYPLDVLYENLAKLPARTTTVVLDACFSGTNVYENISPLVLEVQEPVITAKNMVVLASAGGAQVSSWYHEKNHSMFTYFLLKALKDRASDANGDNKLTYDEVFAYVSDKSEGVPYYARRINGVEQNPTISGRYHGKVFLAY